MSLNAFEAALMVLAMGVVILLCRVFPFVFFRSGKSTGSKAAKALLDFVELVAPPAAMTVLAINALGPSIRWIANFTASASGTHPAALIAALLTVALHLVKRNPLISIMGGTAAYMILINLI